MGRVKYFKVLAPRVARRLGKSYNFLEKPILIVICKLNSFIDSHVRELRKRGRRADFTVKRRGSDEKAILDGEFTFVFCKRNGEKWFHLKSTRQICLLLYQHTKFTSAQRGVFN